MPTLYGPGGYAYDFADAIVVQIAKEMVEILNAASAAYTIDQEFTAQRSDFVVTDMSDLPGPADGPQVSVLIPGHGMAGVWDLSRRLRFDWELSVWIQQRTDGIQWLNDGLWLLVEEIITLFLGEQFAIATGMTRCIGAEMRALPDPAQLDITRVFTCGIFFSFRKTQ